MPAFFAAFGFREEKIEINCIQIAFFAVISLEQVDS